MDMMDLESDEFNSVGPDAEAEKHLRSPILASLLERLLDLYTVISQESLKNRFKKVEYPHIAKNVEQYYHSIIRKHERFSYSNLSAIAKPFIIDLILTSSPPKIVEPKDYKIMFSRILPSKKSLESSLIEANELYHSEIKAYKEWATVPELERIAQLEIDFNPKIQNLTYLYYERYRYWDFIVERYRSSKQKKKFGKCTLTLDGILFFFYDGFIMEQHGKPQMVNGQRIPPIRQFYSFEQAQMFQDASLARFNSFLAIDGNMHNADPSIRRSLHDLLIWQEDILTSYNNAGYELVKGPESICKAYLNSLTHGDVLHKSSFARTVDKLAKKETDIGGSTNFTRRLVEIVKRTSNLHNVAELFGCTKLSGHPFVYAEISAKSVRTEGTPLGNLDLVTIRDYHNIFKRLVLIRYLTKHKVWPLFKKKKTPRESSELYTLWKQNILYLTDNSFPLSDLTDVEFDKFMEFDYSPDYLDMIDDKAINPGGKHAAGFWHQQSGTSYRRLLEALIKKEDIDTKKIVERMRRGNFYLDEYIIELTQKEREFKTSARCFCKLTFEVRLFFVLTEANLKRFMGGPAGDDGYLPQQTMTLSSTKLRRRLYDLSSQAKRYNTCIVEVDFSRWNLRWRAASVNPISRTLEYIFGLPGVFSQAHSFFENSTVVITDKHTLPRGVKPGMPAHQWPSSELVWRGHRGGFEGIQQTLWTICTVAMMYYALRDEQCSFLMAGQGDNQVFHLTFNLKKNQTLSSALLKLLMSLERECEKLNHEIKPEECVDSSTVLTYGKEIYAEGVHIQYSIKFSSRAFARLDHSVPSLSKEIAGIVSNSIAVSGTLKNTFRAIWWKFMQVILAMKRRMNSPVYSIEKSGLARLLRNSTSRKILLIPGSLGGFPMMPWTRFFSKGETDDLSFDTAATFYLSKVEPTIKRYMSLLLRGEFTPNTVDVTNLINDPHSVPIDRPNDATHLISDIVGKKLPSLVKNKDIKPLVQPTLRRIGEAYKSLLTTMQPLYPQIAADMFDLTPAGLYNKTVKRFSMTRTIERLVPGISIEHKVAQSNLRLLNTLIDRFILAIKTPSTQHPKPYLAAQKLRSLWGIGLKNSSIGIYTPFDFPIGYFTTQKAVISASVKPGTDIINTKGSCPPNFGTATMQKTSDHGYRIVNCNSTMRDLKSAVLIYSELQGDESITPLVDSIIEARSPWSTSQLIRIFPTQYGGTSVHRHAASRNHFAVLGSCSVPTHINFSSDRAGILSGGEFDYPVVFQTLYLTLTNLYQNIAAAGITLPSTLAYMIPDELDAIDTSPAKYPNKAKMSLTWPNLRGNKLAWVDELFATEVPTVPDPNLIPHITTVRPLDLVYSYLETKISPSSETKKIWDGILASSDFFDFKEISRVDPYVVERAMSWVILTDTYFEAISRMVTDKKISIISILKRKSLYYSGGWVRTRLHPSFFGTEYNTHRLIALNPTDIGFKKPVEYMASQMIKTIKNSIETGRGEDIPNMILFNNWTEKAASLGKRRLIIMHVIATQARLTLSQLQSQILNNTPPMELLSRDPTVFLYAASKPISRKIAGYDYTLPESKNYFINLSPEEAFRTLRELPLLDEGITRRYHMTPTYINHGLIKYKIGIQSGISKPNQTGTHLPSEDRLRVLLRRTIGATSPLYSDWNAVLSHVVPLMYNTVSEFHLFGIGRGSTARFFCDRRIRCIGYDLQSTFPNISHRSASYIPPEIAISSNVQYYAWSDHTFRTSGDVLCGDLDISSTEQKVAAIIDLDCNLDILLRVLKRLSIGVPLVIRHRGSQDEIKYLISILKPERVYALCIVDGEIRDAILCVSKCLTIGTGNFLNVHILSGEEINYKNTNNELTLQLLDVAPDLCRFLDIDTDLPLENVRDLMLSFSQSSIERLPSEMQNYLRIIHYSIYNLSMQSRDLRIYSIMKNLMNL